jgi:prepilin-type N-terminal cleavage/methylation domain-containing protein
MKKSGFTLIELLMVSVILAVLAAIAIPNFTRMQMRAKESEVKSVCHMVQVAVEDVKTTPGQEGMKPTSVACFRTYLPTNVLSKRNPFNSVETYGTDALVDGYPGALGRVGYIFVDQRTPYLINAMGSITLILTLVEGE